MTDLDLALRAPGRVLLLERGAAQALLDRSVEDRRGSSLLSRAMGAIGRLGRPRALADDSADVDRTKLALPILPWAGSIEWGEGYAIVDGIAVIDVTGVLTPDGHYDWWEERWYGGYAQIGEAVVAARADDRVTALLMRINSPGGLVDGCFDLADLIADGNGAAGGKPVWVHTSLACSAAYALASSADHIVATAEGDVGSIGVLIQHVDISGWYDELGIKVEAIQSGARKTDGASWKPLSGEARAHLQGVVDQVARRFVGVVSRGRGLEPEAIFDLEAQWFLAQHDDPAQSGIALGLVDEIASERAAFAALAESLSGTSEDGAPAETGTDAAGSAARAAKPKETAMSLKDQIEALRAKAAKGDKKALAELAAMGVPIKALADDADDDRDEQDAEADDDDGDDGEDGDDKDDAEADDGSDAAGDDEDDDDDDKKEPEAKATGTKAGFALMSSKQARGREGLARKLGAKVAARKLSYGEAVGMLASAPRGSRLGNAMAGRDRNPGSGGSEAAMAGASLGGAVDRMLARQGRKAI